MSGSTNLNVLTTVALKGILEQLAPEFRQSAGCALMMSYGPGGVVIPRLRAGAPCDVIVVTPETIEPLVAEGHVVAGSQRIIARSIIGVAVRAGAPHPRIATVDDFRDALLRARSVAYTDPATGAASGVHLMQLLDRMGIAEAVKAKARLGDGGPVAEYVARGEAELAIQQICEHRLVAGVEVVGPVPAEFQKVTTFAAGVATGATAPQGAIALIRLLTAPHIQAAMPSHGLEPVQT